MCGKSVLELIFFFIVILTLSATKSNAADEWENGESKRVWGLVKQPRVGRSDPDMILNQNQKPKRPLGLKAFPRNGRSDPFPSEQQSNDGERSKRQYFGMVSQQPRVGRRDPELMKTRFFKRSLGLVPYPRVGRSDPELSSNWKWAFIVYPRYGYGSETDEKLNWNYLASDSSFEDYAETTVR